MRFLALIILIFLAATTGSIAQNDDRGFLTRKIEESLAGAGRDVKLEGFRGVLTSQASFEKLTIADDTGIWLTLTDVVLDWKRAALLRGRFEVKTLSAKSLDLQRLPQGEDKTEIPAAEAGGFSLPELPVSINIETFKVDEISLGEPVLGEAVKLSILASARLEDGTFETSLAASRTDLKEGRFDVDVRFDQPTEELGLKLEVVEEAGGIAARILRLPGHPEIDLTVNGTGVLSDFIARIALASDTQPRLTGQVQLSAQTDGLEGQKPDRRIQADLSGDIATLLAPKYQPFFGSNIALSMDATTSGDGGMDVTEFSLAAEQASFDGRVRLDSDFWPVFLDLDAVIAHPDGGRVLMPVGGPETLVSRMELMVKYDAAAGDRLDGVFDLKEFERGDMSIRQSRVEVGGSLRGEVGSVGRLLVDVSLAARDIDPGIPELADAIGPQLTATTSLDFTEDQPVRLSDLNVQGEDYAMTGSVIADDVESGLLTKLNVLFAAENLGRFSGVAQRELSGAAKVRADGQVAPLAGTFDLKIDGTGTDLEIGQQQADALLAGLTKFGITASRTTTGTEVPRFEVSNPALRAEAQASLRTGGSQVKFDAALSDIAVLSPDYSGALSLSGEAGEDDRGWSVDFETDGPYESRVELAGLVTGPDADVTFKAGLPDISFFVPQIPGPLATEGRATKSASGWEVGLSATGPGGTSADVSGLVEDSGDLDLEVAGALPLGLSGPFLAPRVLQGQLNFDVLVRGAPALSSLSGSLTTTDAAFSAPNLRLALADIAASVNFDGGNANIEVSGAVSSGGTVSASGPVQLTGGLNSDINVGLNGVKLTDPNLYETSLDGSISVNGPLAGGARISGKIDVGPTEIKVPEAGLGLVGEVPDIEHVAEPIAVATTRARAGFVKEEAAEQDTGRKQSAYLLDIEIDAPSRIFVRGRGLDAELGGNVRLSGATDAIVSSGRFDLVRGRLDILAKRFTLDEGIIQLQGSLLPYIRFVTSTTTSDFTARIILDGPVDEPEVSFESTPEAPEDEILAQLLFGESVSDMSAFQALRLANAVAVLAGGSSVGVIGKLRSGFGLDNLDVTTDDEGVTQVQVGKYLTEDIYTDITSGSDGKNEFSVNIDLSPSLTAKGTVDNEGESSLGLFFERDY